MRSRLVAALAVLLGLAASAPADADVRQGLQLDGSPTGDLLLYQTDSGRWFNALFEPALAGGFAVRGGEWQRGWSVTPARYDDDNLTDAFLYDPVTGEYAWAVNRAGTYELLRGFWSAGWSVFVADFDADRRHDMLRYDTVSGEWSKCLNVGSGRFHCVSGTSAPGRTIVAADFDGDDRTDVLSYDAATGQFDRHLTSADGLGFSSTRSGVWSAGWEIHTVNLNGDESADLFLYHPATGDWYHAVTTGDDRLFAYAGAHGVPGLAIVPADLDGDQLDDIVAYNPERGRWIEGFTAPGGLGFRSFAEGQWAPGWSVHATDFDDDGRDDVFLYDPITGRYFQCLNVGAGMFHYTSGAGARGLTIASTVRNVVVGTDVVDHPNQPVLRKRRIMAFGDSITFGSHSRFALPVDRNHASYPSQLVNLLRSRYPQQSISMSNLGIPGETAREGSRRLGVAIDTIQPDLLLLLEGINDINGGADAVTVSNSIEDMLAIARAKGVDVLLAKLTPVTSAADPQGLVTTTILSLNSRFNDVVKVYSMTAPVDLYGAMVGNLSLLGADGLHPTDEGYEVMARTFFAAITQRFETLARETSPPAAVTGSRD